MGVGHEAHRMIGREAELQVLHDAFAAGRAGEPRVLVIRGEAGIGKTRLLEEFRRVALASSGAPPVVFAVGQCVEVGAIGVPFTAIRRLLRGVYAGVGDAAFRAAVPSPAFASALTTLVPELDDEPTVDPGSGDLVTESIERLVENLSADHHLVLVIEDLHWADAATLDLLKVLAVTLRGRHVTVIMTYRSDDVGRTHPLRRVLAELDRSRLVAGLELRRLDDDAAMNLARQLAPAIPRDALAVVVDRSEGVPFFMEELVDLDGADLPDTLRTIVMARYERLSETTAEVVGVLAAGGVHVDHDTLAAVHARDAAELDAALREAISSNVLLADEQGYTFRHALIREVVHDDLLPSTRSRLHRRYAEALQTRVDAGEEDTAALVAEHWLAARDVERAFAATCTARQHATRTSAPTAAALLGERLLDLWPQVSEPERQVGETLPHFASGVAEQWHDAVGDVSRAIRIAKAALADADGDPVAEGRLRLISARALANAGRKTASMEEARRATAALEATSDAASLARLARVLALRASNLGGDQPTDERVDFLDRAIAAAESSGSLDAIAYCLMQRAVVHADLLETVAAVDMITRAQHLGAALPITLNCANFRAAYLIFLGRFEEAVAVAEKASGPASRAGMKHAFGAMLGLTAGEGLLAVGQPERAASLVRQSGDLLGDLPIFTSYILQLKMQQAVWGDDVTTAMSLRQDGRALQIEEDIEDIAAWAEADADAAFADGSADSAARAVAALRPMIAPLVPLGSCLRLLPTAMRTAAQARIDGAEDADVDRLDDLVDQACAVLDDPELVSAVAAFHAAERARADPAISAQRRVRAWSNAVAAGETGRIAVRHRHYARFRLVECLLAAEDRDAAIDHARRLLAEAPGHGVALIARWTRELLARAGIPDPLEAPAGDTGPSKPHAALTPRESQVLALVAEGLTNAEIGRRLFISPKTASVHVSAILAKVGAANRAEAAAKHAALR